MRATKKQGVAASLIVLLSMTLSACGETAPTPTAVAPTAAPTQATASDQGTPTVIVEMPTPTSGGTASGGTVTGSIDFQVFGDPAELAVFKSVADGFKAVQPNATVNLVQVPSQGDHMTKLSAAFAAGAPPDVFLINYRRYGQFASKGVIEPAGPLMAKSGNLKEEDYFPQVLDAFRYKGTLMCVPQNISSLQVYYNKDLFTKSGAKMPAADWTWDDFTAAASAITKDNDGDGKIDVYGVGVEPQLIRLAPFIWANGGELVDNADKPTTLALDNPKTREALQFFVDLQRSYKVVPTEPEAKAEDDETRFMNGKLGMLLQSRAATPSLREIKGFEWDVAPIPVKERKATILHSDAYCIAAASKNKDLAWAFVEYAQGKDGQTIAAKLGRTVPSRKDVAESEAFLNPGQPPASSKVWLDMVPDTKLVPILSTWPEIENKANQEIERAFYGLITVDEAIQLAMEETKPLFANAESAK